MINELKKYAENLTEVYSLEQEMGQYQYLIDIGNKAPSFSKDEQNEINKMFGCQAQVWIISKINPSSRLHSGVGYMPLINKM